MSSFGTDKILSVEFSLSICSDEYLKYYRGQIKWVIAISNKGLKVKFPANLLKPYIARDGIKGRFNLQYLTSGKAVSLTKIS
jgi:hypothetical protein